MTDVRGITPEPLDCLVCGRALNAMPLRPLDPCVTTLVLTLNAAGFATVASCCGHGVRPAAIALADGRELVICRDWDQARRIDALFPPIEPGTS